MHRVGGQRVLEMDHFVESTATPIVRLRLEGAPEPASSREAAIAARKVLERKLLLKSSNAPTLNVPATVPAAGGVVGRLSAVGSFFRRKEATGGGGSAPPPVRVLTALGADDTRAEVGAHITKYAALFWDVLVEVVEHVMRRRARDVIASLYYMPTIRADVFVCSALPNRAAPADGAASPSAPPSGSASGASGAELHLNVLVFEQSLSCDLDGGDHTQPLRVASDKWRTLLPYWLHRLGAALREATPDEAPARSTPSLYDRDVRERLMARIQARSGAAEPMTMQRASWTPAPLPTEVLVRA